MSLNQHGDTVATCSDIEASFSRQLGKLWYMKCFMIFFLLNDEN